MLQPYIISLLYEIICALPYTCSVHSILCILLLSSVSKIRACKNVRMRMVSIHLHTLMSLTDLQGPQKHTRPLLCLQTAQLDNLTPYTAISSIGWLESSPHCSVCFLRLSLERPGTPASSTRSLVFNCKSWQSDLLKWLQLWAAFKLVIMQFEDVVHYQLPAQTLEIVLKPLVISDEGIPI